MSKSINIWLSKLKEGCSWKYNGISLVYKGYQYVDFKTFYDWIMFSIARNKKIKRDKKDKQLEVQLKFIKELNKDINKEYEGIKDFLNDSYIEKTP